MKHREHILAHIIGYAILLSLLMVFISNLPAYSVAPEVGPPVVSAPDDLQQSDNTDELPGNITDIMSMVQESLQPIVPRPPRPVLEDTLETMTLDEVIGSLAPQLRPELKQLFNFHEVDYPPSQLTIIALKEERLLELWSPDRSGTNRMVMSFPIYGASGDLGPKLRQGDLQVPEGFYKVLWFNPNSQFYLSMKIDYPNEFDLRMARGDGRTDLGGDIFIHGYDVSLGCLAIGNPAIEKLFLLVHDTGRNKTGVIIAPYDLRTKSAPASGMPVLPAWTETLYSDLKTELNMYVKSEHLFSSNLFKMDFLPIPHYLVAAFQLSPSR